MQRGLCLVVFLVACGGGGSADTPPEKCEALIDVVCERAVECTTVSNSQCVMEVESIIDCNAAKMVSSTYDACIDQLESDSCAVLFPGGQLELPPDCNGVIQQREALPEPQGAGGLLGSVESL